jgi:tRNA(Ile)-lysidine synthetase-like protein
MDLKVNLPEGKYVLAVSGGVDSVVLLDLLSNIQHPTSNIQLIIAHFDHGIRKDSQKDAKLVENFAKKYKLPFEIKNGKLGKDVSEAEAREKRYAFLHEVKSKHKAVAIITAHHQDDLIETSIINILRGTGRRGLSSLKNRDETLRPLLNYPKKELVEYAKQHKLDWREDSTNQDPKYLRNMVRQNIMPKITSKERKKWLNILTNVQEINKKIDKEVDELLRRGLHKNQLVLNRSWFIMLPHKIAKEVVLNLLVRVEVTELDRKSIERITVQIKTLPAGKILQATDVDVLLTKRSARFKSRKLTPKHL